MTAVRVHRPSPRRVAGRLVLAALVLTGVVLAASDPFTTIDVLIYGTVGSVLVDRRPRNPIGWLLLLIGFSFIGTTARSVDEAAMLAGTSAWAEFLVVWSGPLVGNLGFVAYAALAYVFPSGSLPEGRRGLIARVVLLVATGAALLPAIAPSMSFMDGRGTETWVPNRLSPFAGDGAIVPPPELVAMTTIVPLIAATIAIVDLLGRYRRSTGITRLQIRWVLAAVSLYVPAVLFGLIVFVGIGPAVGIVAWLPALLVYPLIGLSVGVAIMRYRLFEIDRLVSRTISYLLISATLFGVFALVNLATQAVLGELLNGDTVGIAVSTLVVAALFAPLRDRLQGAVDRRFNRARLDQEAILAQYAATVRDEIDLDRLSGHLTDAVHAAVEPSELAIWRPKRAWWPTNDTNRNSVTMSGR